MIHQVTLAFLESIRTDAEFRAQIVKDADDELAKRYSVTFLVDDRLDQRNAILETALWKCLSALSRDDVVEALKARLLETSNEFLSDGDIIGVVRGIDPDLVKV